MNDELPWTMCLPDYATSPHTGMVRDHWIALGTWFLDGLFGHVAADGYRLDLPKVPGKSYPQAGQPAWKFTCAEFEAVVRSLNLAGPLLEIDPELESHGHAVGDCYVRWLLTLTRPYAAGGLPRPADLPEVSSVQMTCEAGGLAVVLLLCPGFWARFSQAGKDQIAEFLHGYAHARTGGHNWRYFNVMMLLFLVKAGYTVDRSLLRRHLEALLALHVGAGWYADFHIDYYTFWVFQLYGSIVQQCGPGLIDDYLLAELAAHSSATAEVYPRIFNRSGHMAMWGRSICYRTAVAAVLPWLSHGTPPPLDPGWARRIASGNLLQFAGRAGFRVNGLPSLGFYGHFEPVIQFYSCAASPMWMHFTFLSALSQPADAPFWTSIENEGIWRTWDTEAGVPRWLTVDGAAVQVANFPLSGETELITGRVESTDGGLFSTDAMYQHLAFHSRYTAEDLDPDHGMAMHYAWVSPRFFDGSLAFHTASRIEWCGERDGVLYRRLQMSDKIEGTFPCIDLAEFRVARGTVRIDRCRLFHGTTVRICHYALPHQPNVKPTLQFVDGEGCRAAILTTDSDSLALVVYSGWDRLGSFQHQGFNAECPCSTVLFAEADLTTPYPETNTPFVAALLHRRDGVAWSMADLQVVELQEFVFRRNQLRLTVADGDSRRPYRITLVRPV
jgi:hypothetical protein